MDTGISHLFIPKYPEAYAVWMGKIFGVSHYKNKYGVDQVHYVDEVSCFIILILNGMRSKAHNPFTFI